MRFAHSSRRSPDPSTALTVARIDASAIAANVARVRAASGAPRVMAVVKADGYGHGAATAARAALDGGADQLGVVTPGEALALRDAGVRAPILAWIWEPGHQAELVERAVGRDVDLAVQSVAHLDAVIAAGRRVGRRPRVTVKADTGMNRGGFSVVAGDLGAAADALAEAHRSGAVEVTGVMSHLACADEPGHPSIDMQAGRFRDAIAALRDRGLEVPVNHLANSAAAVSRPDLAFDMVRPGIALYGHEPFPGAIGGLRPAMTLTSRVQLVKDVPAGEAVSYGRTWTAERDTRVAVVPWGYADGLPRALSGRFSVAIGGRRYPQVGRVCMDQFVVEVGDAVHPGDEVRIFGDGSGGEMTATELADAMGTISYEIVTAVRGRVVRVEA
ncbi:alanine racemase [Corynebacterium sp.]|uniref:alanine racemase n=1 Tax=Corynebacterium sp. TaxID=1720 RepID=UPI0026DC34C0|nr:alanine racemase [Corynebacterium sp.]MDO4610038.1 alanine racemase [Corynebacterium sp.]